MSINIIGAGIAGLSCAINLAKEGISSNLISLQPSERAQSVLAEGGINAALNVMGEDDSIDEHFADTMNAGKSIADEEAVKGLCENAPSMIEFLKKIGVPFQRENGKLIQRNFGGQKKKRTAYSKSSTGKVIVSALIDEARKYEACGLVTRFSNHCFVDLIMAGGAVHGCIVADVGDGSRIQLFGSTVIACGGFHGIFREATTGSYANTGDTQAILFNRGVVFSNLEMIQFHPTTITIPNKRCLISEAARGEGGRLYTMRGNEKWYFMEEKYPELKNLMPRDVVSREIYTVMNDSDCSGEVFLDMTHLTSDIWDNRLSDLREEIMHYMDVDPKTEPVKVVYGIHYFMGGINVDKNHRTNIDGLYAAGECASIYHGANRLGGNSLLGALYGGYVTAGTIIKETGEVGSKPVFRNEKMRESVELRKLVEKLTDNPTSRENGVNTPLYVDEMTSDPLRLNKRAYDVRIRDIIMDGLGIVRDEESMIECMSRLTSEMEADNISNIDRMRLNLALAMVKSALYRKESRGAHYRSDYLKMDDRLDCMTYAVSKNDSIEIGYLSAQLSD